MSDMKMRAVIGRELGPVDNYELLETEIPQPRAHEVQIAVRVASMGYVDALISRGLYQVKPQLPYCPGLEMAGTVSAVGSAVASAKVGDRVCASAFGGALADYAVVPETALNLLPRQLDFRAAAGFVGNYLTAWHGLLDRGELKAGETVLVLGAAGGVGSAAIQVARLAGARVVAGASTKEKRDYALTLGAHDTIDYSKDDWRAELRKVTAGKGVDVVFDPVAGSVLETAFRSLAWRGRHLVVGFAGGDIPSLPVNLPLMKGSALIGVDSRQFFEFEQPAAQEVRGWLFAAVARGDLVPAIGATFSFENFRDAMELAAGRDGLGKTIVVVSEG